MRNFAWIAAGLLIGSVSLAYPQQRAGTVSSGSAGNPVISQVDGNSGETRPRTLGSSNEGRASRTSDSPEMVPPTELSFSTRVSFHHVWATDVGYGYFRSNGLDLYYEIEGKGREYVVVVHGCPGIPHDYLHPMLSSLGNYAKVVYFDRRFDGLPKGLPRSAMTVASMTDDLEALRLSLGVNRMTLLAHGFGGPVALSYAIRYPDNVKRLILVGSSAVIESPAEIERRLTEVMSPEDQAAYRSVQEGAATPLERDRKRYRALLPGCFHKPPDGRMLERDTYYIYFDALARRYALADEPGGVDLRGLLGRIRVPTLILGGKFDPVNPLSHSDDLAKGLPYSRLVVMSHSGHFPYFEEGHMFTQSVRRFVEHTSDQNDDAKVIGPTVSPQR